MKRAAPIFLAGLASLFATLTVSPASDAAPPKVGGYCNPTPSAATCKSRAFQQSECFARTKAYCAPVYEAEAAKQYAALPVAPENRVVPDGVPRRAAGSLTPTKVIPYDEAGDVQGAPGTYASFMYKLRYENKKKAGIPITRPIDGDRGGILGAVNPALTGPGGIAALPAPVQTLIQNIVRQLPLTISDPRVRWASNGNKIQSCEEYTYEKFYSFSKFEDLIAEMDYRVGSGDDRRKIFEALAAATADGYVHRRGPGFPAWFAIAKDPDGPRNPFFVQSSFIAIDYYDRWVDSTPWAFLSKDRRGYGSPVDTTLTSLIPAGALVPGWTWAEHRARGAAFIASTSSERFAQLDSLKTEHLANVDAYKRMALAVEVCTIRRQVGSHAFKKLDPRPAWCNAIMVHYDEGDAWTDGYNGPDVTEYAQEDAIADTIRLNLAVTEANVMATLREAKALGCLDPHAAPQPCDWSARDIVNKIIAAVRTEEEAAYSKCMKFTHGDLTSPASVIETLATKEIRFPGGDGTPGTGAPIVAKGLRGSDSNFDFDLVYDAFQRWVEALNYDRDPITGLTVIAQTQQDHQHTEAGQFGVDLDYLVGWRLDNYSADTAIPGAEYAGDPTPRMCNAEAHVRGHAALTATVLGGKQEIFGADANIETNHSEGRMKAQFRILGLPFYDPPEQRGDLTVAIAFTKQTTDKLVEVSGVIPVMGVPVTLRAGVTGTVGVSGSLSGPGSLSATEPARPRDCVASPDTVTIGVKGTFEPFISVDGYASASVDIGIAEGGIKGELQLARLGMPLNVEVGIRAKAAGPNGPNGPPPNGNVPGTPEFELYVKTGMDLTFSTMDGRVAMFLDFPFYSTEQTLTSWQGLHYGTNIFTRESKLPLEFLTVVDKL